MADNIHNGKYQVLIDMARQQNNQITEAQVHDFLPDVADKDHAIEYLKSECNVDVVEDALEGGEQTQNKNNLNLDNIEEPEHTADRSAVQLDGVRDYMVKMGAHSLFDREKEIQTSVNIENGNIDIMRQLAKDDRVIEEVIAAFDRYRQGDLELRSIITSLINDQQINEKAIEQHSSGE